MHEVSLMTNLLEIAAGAARREGASKIDAIHLRIGELAGVNIDALRFAFEILARGTPAEGGRLEYETVALRARCRGCKSEFRPDGIVLRCSSCRSNNVELMSGRELEIDYILIEKQRDETRSNG